MYKHKAIRYWIGAVMLLAANVGVFAIIVFLFDAPYKATTLLPRLFLIMVMFGIWVLLASVLYWYVENRKDIIKAIR